MPGNACVNGGLPTRRRPSVRRKVCVAPERAAPPPLVEWPSSAKYEDVSGLLTWDEGVEVDPPLVLLEILQRRVLDLSDGAAWNGSRPARVTGMGA